MNECLNETGIIIPFCSGREGDSETMSWGPAEKLQEPHPRPLTPGHAPSTTPQSTELLRLQRGPTGALETSLGTRGPRTSSPALPNLWALHNASNPGGFI